MHAPDLLGAIEVGERARDAEHTMIAACGEPHRVGGVAQEREPACVRPCDVLEDGTCGGRVGAISDQCG